MKGLLTSPLRSGVYELADDTTLAARLRHAGWYVGAVDVGDAREAVVAVGAELGLPGYYGRNLDALRDSLSDLDRPTALLVHLPSELGHYAEDMPDILVERAGSRRAVPFALMRLPGSPSS